MYQYETKKTREPVVQRYEIIDKRKISDDYSLQMIDSHFFYAKQGLFKSGDLAGRPFHLQKKETIDGYDKITGEYGEHSGDDLTAPSDCGLFAGLVLNNARPKAAFLFNDVLQQTDAQTDPSSYRPYIIRHLLAYVHTVPDDVMAGALDESSLLRSLCAQIPNAPDTAIPSIITAIQDMNTDNIVKISRESPLLLDKSITAIWGQIFSYSPPSSASFLKTPEFRQFKYSSSRADFKTFAQKYQKGWAYYANPYGQHLRQVLADSLKNNMDDFMRIYFQSAALRSHVKLPHSQRKTISHVLLKDIFYSLCPEDLEQVLFQSPSLSRFLGINQYADPGIGEAFTMLSSERSQHPERDWTFHWAAVVMESTDKKDKIIAENYRNLDSPDNNEWQFDMVGTKSYKQTFHGIHHSTGQHGATPMTLRVVP